MARLHPPKLPPHLEAAWRKSLPKGAKPTPPHELQVNAFPHDEEDCGCECHGKERHGRERIKPITDWMPAGQAETVDEARKRMEEDAVTPMRPIQEPDYHEPRWDLLLDYWQEGDDEC